MKKNIFITLILLSVSFSATAAPILNASKEAAYFAVLKAVLDYKMQDEKIKNDLEKLRENEKFNEWLEKSISQLSNKKNKSGKDQNIYNILLDSGSRVYNQLN